LTTESNIRQSLLNYNNIYMKKNILLFLVISLIGVVLLPSCNRHGCPGIDKKTGEFKMKKNAKTKSGLLPPRKKKRK